MFRRPSMRPQLRKTSTKVRREVRPALESLEGRIVMADGALDTSFGLSYWDGGGYTAVSSENPSSNRAYNSEVRGMVVQPSGKSVIAYQFPYENFVRLTRFTTDGSIDPSFGVNGTSVITIGTLNTAAGGRNDEIRTLLVQADGKLIIAGSDAGPVNAGGNQFSVTRLTVNGALDTSFDGDGKSIHFMGYDARAFAATLQADGKIVVVGSSAASSTDTGDQDYVTLRLNTDGSLDSSFGDLTAPGSGVRTGKVRTPMELYNFGFDEARAVVVLPESQKLFIFGFAKTAQFGGSYTAAVAQLNPDGSWDSSFADGGWRYYSHDEILFDGMRDPNRTIPLAVQPLSGRVVLGGTVTRPRSGPNSSGPQPAVFRFLSNGALDPSFGASGVARFDAPTNIANPFSYLNDLTVGRDDKIVVGGTVEVKKPQFNANDDDYFITRLTASGQIDATFNSSGSSVIEWDWQPWESGSRQSDLGQMVAIQPSDGKILIGGVFQGFTNYEYGVARVLSTLPPKVATSITMTASAASVTVGDSLTFTAAVSPTTARGVVEFFDGNIRLGSSSLFNGVASFTYAGLGVGNHGITARFGETSTHQGSTSAVRAIEVRAKTSSVALTTSALGGAWGTPITLTATLSPGQAGGTVEFFDGQASLGIRSVSGGVASVTVTTLGVGSRVITARYSGDAIHAGSASSALNLTITKASSSTSLTLTPSSAEFGREVKFTAGVSPAQAGGVVVFRDGATEIDRVNLVNGVAVLSSSNLALGSHSISAEYLGNANVTGSTSSASTLQIQPASTSLALTVPTQAGFKEPVTLSAAATSAAGLVTGRVRFFAGDVALGETDLAGGTASLTLAPERLSPGTYAIRAVYDGAGVFAASTSTTRSLTVQPPITATIGLTSGSGPVLVGLGRPVTFSVALTSPSGVPSGDVELYDGAVLLDSAPLSNGSVSFVRSDLATGVHSLRARYLGDAKFAAVNSATLSVEVVEPVATQTGLAVERNSGSFGTVLRLTATVGGSTIPSAGSVDFYDGATFLGRVALSGGKASLETSSLAVGDHSLRAVFGAYERFVGSESSTFPLNVTRAATSTQLAVGNPRILWGESTTLVARPSSPAGTPGGTVSFFLGGSLLGRANVQNGEAVLTTGSLNLGDNAITARYEGQASHGASDSAPAVVNVTSPTSLAVSISSNFVTVGDGVLITAQIASAQGSPAGSVEFFDGAQSLGVAALSGGSASIGLASLPIGGHLITARFRAESPHLDSQSAPAGLVVADVPASAITLINVVRKKTQVLRIELIANGPLDAATAGSLLNYRLAYAGRDRRYGTKDDQTIRFAAVQYNPISRIVTLTPRGKLVLSNTARLVITGVLDGRGRALDGDRNGTIGGGFSALITRKGWSFGG